MKDITVDDIIDAMRRAGGWYLRKRKRVLPALWRTAERNTVAPATPAEVVRFMRATFPAGSRSLEQRAATLIGEAIIADLRYHDHGLPTLDDAALELVK